MKQLKIFCDHCKQEITNDRDGIYYKLEDRYILRYSNYLRELCFDCRKELTKLMDKIWFAFDTNNKIEVILTEENKGE